MLNEIASLINENVSGANATVNTLEKGTSSITVEASHINAVAKTLRDNSK